MCVPIDLFLSGSSSPSPSQHSEADVKCDITFRCPSSQFILSRKEKSKSVPHIKQSTHNLFYSSPPSPSLAVSPLPLTLPQGGGANTSPGSAHTPNMLSPSPFRSFEGSGDHTSSPAQSPSSPSARISPIALAKNFFHLKPRSSSPRGSPRSSSPRGSPRNSPRFGRRKMASQSTDEDRGSEFVHWWMEEVSAGERAHWSKVLEKEGEWAYFWHSVHYKLRPAS